MDPFNDFDAEVQPLRLAGIEVRPPRFNLYLVDVAALLVVVEVLGNAVVLVPNGNAPFINVDVAFLSVDVAVEDALPPRYRAGSKALDKALIFKFDVV